MIRLRRALGPIAVTWLLCQVATIAAAPVVIGLGASEELLECKCTHGDHAICPMHHRPAPGSKICLMGSANNTSTAVLTSLFTGVGLIGDPFQVIAPSSTYTRVRTHGTPLSLRPAPPDPPPPRA